MNDIVASLRRMGIDWAADEIEKSRRTSEYWKAEHLAGNAEIERLQREVINRNARALEGDKAVAVREFLLNQIEELERLRADLDEQCRLLGAGSEREARLMAQLAESQAREAKLREALVAFRFNACRDRLLPSYIEGAWHLAGRALDLPHDDSALKERLRQEREACAKVCDDTEHKYETGRSCAVAIRNLGDE